MNIHVARTPHFRTRFPHTCCQGQTGSLTVRPDTARCLHAEIVISSQRRSNNRFKCLSAFIMFTMFTKQTRGIGPILDQCWDSVVDGGPTLGDCILFAVNVLPKYCCVCMHRRWPKCQQIQNVKPMLVHCWASVVDGGPTLNQ